VPVFRKVHRVAIRSSAIFVLCVVLAASAYSRLLETGLFLSLLSSTAKAAASILKVPGSHVSVSGAAISSGDFSVKIGSGCDGLVPIMLFICAVLAYPGRIKSKGAGVVLGVFCLYPLNLLRIVSLLLYRGAFSRIL
jgi:exosortase/archaeosortase